MGSAHYDSPVGGVAGFHLVEGCIMKSLLCEMGCGKVVHDDDKDVYRQVTSWVHGPKLDGPVLREQTGAVAHGECVRRVMAGQAPDQPTLFDDTTNGIEESIRELTDYGPEGCM